MKESLIQRARAKAASHPDHIIICHDGKHSVFFDENAMVAAHVLYEAKASLVMPREAQPPSLTFRLAAEDVAIALHALTGAGHPVLELS